MSKDILIEQIINSNSIKYDTLSNIVNQAFKNSNKENINFFIDVSSICKSLYNNNYIIEDPFTLTACIINMCAHYRTFFRRWYNTETRFFIIQSNNLSPINRKLIKDYNKKYEELITNNSRVTNMIAQNCQLLKTICPYLPDIYYIETSFETGVVITDIICKDIENKYAHLILSKDVYLYQLTTLRPDVIILRPKKLSNDDISYYIDRYNVINTYATNRKLKTAITIMPENLSLLMTLNNLSERNIKTFISIEPSVSFINKYCNTVTKDFQQIVSLINQNTKYQTSIEAIEHRYNVIDLIRQHMMFLNTHEKNYELLQLYDKNGVQEINNKYFLKNPLDLNRL